MNEYEDDWTAQEEKWIKSLKRLMKRKPSGVKLYVIDGYALHMCKAGVPSDDVSDWVDASIGIGAMLSDLHDDEL